MIAVVARDGMGKERPAGRAQVSFGERLHADPLTALRVAAGVGLGLASTVVGRPYGLPVDLGLLLAALVLAPLDMLPLVVVTLVRGRGTVAGPLTLSDLAAIVYLARVVTDRRVLGVRLTASRVVLALFFLWTALVTLTGLGQQSTIGRLAVYASLGSLLTHSLDAKRWLYRGVLGLAAVELVWYLPQFPGRFFGRLVADPAHMGFLLLCALVLVAASAWPARLRYTLGAVLLFGILCTLTRSVWFASACVGLAALLPRRWWLPLALPPVLAGLLLPLQSYITGAFGLNTGSAGIRLAGFSAGLADFRRHPLTGQGWAAAAAAQARGIGGISQLPVYNVWIYIAAATGLVGLGLFLVHAGLLGHEALGDPVAYLCLTGALGMSLTEMPLYAGSLIALLMLTMTTSRPRRAAHQAPGRGERAGQSTGRRPARHHRRGPHYTRTGART